MKNTHISESEKNDIANQIKVLCENHIEHASLMGAENIEFFNEHFRYGSGFTVICRGCYSIYNYHRGECNCGLSKSHGLFYAVRVTWRKLRKIIQQFQEEEMEQAVDGMRD